MSKRVLIARLDNDGDVFLAGPAIRAVAATAGSVAMLCGPRGRTAAELLPGVDLIVEFCAPWIDPEPERVDREAVLGLVHRLSRLGIDEALVLTSFHQSALPTALLLRLAGVPKIAAASDDYPGSLLDVRHRVGHDIHEVERSLSLVRALGYDLPPGDDGRLAVFRDGEAPVPFGDPYVVVHPGASVPARAWAPALSTALVDALCARGHRVVITGGEGDTGLTARVAGPPREGVTDLGGRTTLAELADVLASAQVLVSGNTGPAHLAAAVGTPVVSLYAPTVPAVRWHPWKVPHELLGWQEIPCSGCRARICPMEGHPCIDRISVGDVVAAVERLADRAGNVRAAPGRLQVVQ